MWHSRLTDLLTSKMVIVETLGCIKCHTDNRSTECIGHLHWPICTICSLTLQASFKYVANTTWCLCTLAAMKFPSRDTGRQTGTELVHIGSYMVVEVFCWYSWPDQPTA